MLYDAVPEENNPAAAYPTYLPDIVNGTVNIQMPLTDTDHDGIYDGWETQYFENLTTADETSDSDKDGYSDLQEYLNFFYPVEKDPTGAEYDPLSANAPGGTGYNPIHKGNIWLLMLPAITHGRK